MKRNSYPEEGKKILMLIREEKKAFSRLKDIIRKYRTLLPFVLGRSDRLEKRISKLMSNSEASEKTNTSLKNQILSAQKRQASLGKKLLEIKIKEKEVHAEYNTLLEGKFPHEETSLAQQKSLEEMRVQKEKLFSNIQNKFDTLEKKMKTFEKKRMIIEKKKTVVDRRIDKMWKRVKMIERKVTLYQEDIQKQLMELHDQLKNERKLTREYQEAIEVIEGLPDLSEWSASLMKEAIHHRFPKAKILELGKPADASAPLQ